MFDVGSGLTQSPVSALYSVFSKSQQIQLPLQAKAKLQ